MGSIVLQTAIREMSDKNKYRKDSEKYKAGRGFPRPPTVPVEMDDRAEKILKDIYRGCINIKAARIEDDNLHVFGSYKVKRSKLLPGYTDSFELEIDIRSGDIIRKEVDKETRFYQALGLLPVTPCFPYHIYREIRDHKRGKRMGKKIKEMEKINRAELIEAIKHIKAYQGYEEIERKLGVEFEMVDTGEPVTWLSEFNELMLRYEAWKIGADAVARCEAGSARGTPVRFVKK